MKKIFGLLVFVVLARVCVSRDDEDEENFDPYTTMDPAKREPHPCESSSLSPSSPELLEPVLCQSVIFDEHFETILATSLHSHVFTTLVCKYLATELRDRLEKSAKSKEIIRTGHGLEKKKQFAYATSELRLTEALHEPHICENILEYNVHAERKGSLRYAKGMSETFQTLHGLVNKGVKVELGIPHELWDKPSAEVTKMHRWCFNLAEQYEDDIEDWYYNHQDQDLFKYLCKDRYLKDKNSDSKCLDEVFVPKGDDETAEEDEESKQKKKKKAKNTAKKGDTAPSDEPPVETQSPPSDTPHTEL